MSDEAVNLGRRHLLTFLTSVAGGIGVVAVAVPFLASLKDVQSYLSLDLSRKGLDSVKDLAKKARANGDVVKSRIDAVVQQTNAVRGMLATKPAG